MGEVQRSLPWAALAPEHAPWSNASALAQPVGAMAAIGACPKLQASVKAVAAHKGVAKYRESRGLQAT